MFGLNFQLHNFFPNLSKQNFVLNLGSQDREIANLSLQLITKALEWSSDLESKYYAFHAPFLMNPTPSELGKRFKFREEFESKNDVISTLLENLHKISKISEDLGIEIALENNVFSHDNYLAFDGKNPFLLTGSDIVPILDEIGLSLLLDFGHLNVSCKTLGLDKLDLYHLLKNKISGYHLSHNNSLSDTNETFDENVWFLKNSLIDNNKPITIEVYSGNFEDIHQCRRILENSIYEN